MKSDDGESMQRTGSLRGVVRLVPMTRPSGRHISFTMSAQDGLLYSLVSDRLYLTCVDSAADVSKLRRLGVTHVLSIIDAESLPGPAWHEKLKNAGIWQKTLELDDTNDNRIDAVLDHSRELLHSILISKSTNVVLVHCYAGISRSATCVLNYWLYAHPLWSVETALRNLRHKRSVVQPNPYFMKTLRTLYNQEHRQI